MKEYKLKYTPNIDVSDYERTGTGMDQRGFAEMSQTKLIQVGSGGNEFRVDSTGLFLGAEQFANAPFRVDLLGNAVLNSLIVTGGTIKFGKNSFTDSVNAGYYLGIEGWYIGAAGDVTKLKYIIATGVFDYIGTHSGGSVAGVDVSQVGYVATSTADIVPLALDCSSTAITTATDGTTSAYVILTWTAISSNTFDHYIIRYKKASYTYYTQIPANTNTITIDGLVPNVSYNFGIASVNKYGTASAFSADISQTTASDTTAPATVTADSATAGIQYIILEWTHNTESDLASYNIYRNTTNNSGTATLIGNCRTNYFIDGGRTGDQIYYYWVKAVDTSGNLSASFSTVKSATPRNVTSDDVVTLAGSKVLIDGAVYLSNWRKTGDLTKIDGGSISTHTVTLTELNFTPVQSTDVIAKINASAEGIKIDADNITISGSTTFAAGYDPTISFPSDINLVGKWSLDEGAGTIAKDSTGVNNGAITGATYVDGIVGTALNFNGTTNFIDCGADASLDIISSISISVWIKNDTLSGADMIIGKGITAHTYFIYTDGANVKCGFYDGANWKIVTGTTPLSTGVWYHLVYIFNDTTNTITLYRNGISDGILSNVTTNPVSEPTYKMSIGAYNQGVTGFFDGLIDEVRIYNIALTTQEVLALYRFPAGSTQQGVSQLGGSYASAASGARVLIFPDANTGIQIIDDAANDVFKTIVGGTNIGDVIMGNESIGQYTKWDKSEAKLIVNGTNLVLTTTFGDGSDGDVTISANTTITRDMFYNNLTINSTKILSCGGFRISVKGILTNNGTISIIGGNGGNGQDGQYGANSTGGTAGVAVPTNSIYGGSDGKIGGQGTNGTTGGPGVAGLDTTKSIVGNGVAGGKGGTNTAYAGGIGGVAGTNTGTIYNTPYQFVGAYLMYDFNPSLTIIKSSAGSGSGGAGGGHTSPNSASGGAGGGSGASAGICWISAKTIINNGIIAATGGNGGNGGNWYFEDDNRHVCSGGGGGGGDGGLIILIYSQLTNSGTISPVGGAKGNHGTQNPYYTENPVSADGVAGSVGKIIYIQL